MGSWSYLKMNNRGREQRFQQNGQRWETCRCLSPTTWKNRRMKRYVSIKLIHFNIIKHDKRQFTKKWVVRFFLHLRLIRFFSSIYFLSQSKCLPHGWLCLRSLNRLCFTNWTELKYVAQKLKRLMFSFDQNRARISNLWWMPTSVSRNFGTARKVGSSRKFLWYPTSSRWESRQLPFAKV